MVDSCWDAAFGYLDSLYPTTAGSALGSFFPHELTALLVGVWVVVYFDR
jgi:hypothetical protein